MRYHHVPPSSAYTLLFGLHSGDFEGANETVDSLLSRIVLVVQSDAAGSGLETRVVPDEVDVRIPF